MNAPPIAREVFAAELFALLGDRQSSVLSVRSAHGSSEAYHGNLPPDWVAWPQSTAEVQCIVRLCVAHRVPVIAYGVGTSLEGNTAAPHGGVCLDMSRMNQVLEINSADLDCRVQPGVTRKALNAALRDTGLFFPIDPGADASLGGMASTRASGTMAVRYGTMRENVLALEVVLPDGRIIRTSRRARKSSAGYDLTRMFVGAEGTLGVLTEITVKLHPQPEAVSAAVCPFATLADAVNAVITTIQAGVPVARIELLNDTMVRGINAYSRLAYPEQPTLFFEFHGTPASCAEQAERTQAIAAEFGGQGFQWATRPEDRSRLWHARDNTLYAGLGLRPGSRAMITDVCVPISRLADCLLQTQHDIEASGLLVPIVGHVGDGNFHLLILIDPNRPEELLQAKSLHDAMVRRALSMDGTCTGEHGIGLGKIDFLESELGDAVDVMRTFKQALDPLNLMNPGKIFRLP